MRKKIIKTFVIIITLLGLVGCSSNSQSENTTDSSAKKITIPDVTGTTEEIAQNKIVEIGLIPVVERVNSDTVEAGNVVRMMPEAGSEAEENTKVVLMVSDGNGKADDENASDSSVSKSEPSVVNNYYYYGQDAANDNDYYYNVAEDGYLWPTDSYYISYSDLDFMEKDTVRALLNEIYARHGYVFETARWSTYFNNKSWYVKNPNVTKDTVNGYLSSVEKKNIETIAAYEKKMGWR